MKELTSLLSCLLLFSATLNSSISAEPQKPTDLKKPWVVNGVVVQESGEPLAEVDVIAHTGIGSLFMTGRTKTQPDGTFELRFAPGVHFQDQEGVQAATISVRKEGWFETNLYRQGDLLAAFKLPRGEIGWGDKTAKDVFLPGEPKTLKFTMRPAANLSGVLKDPHGTPIRNQRVGITGDQLPPSSGVFAEVKTNEQGEFEFKNLPTTYKLKLYVEAEKNWRTSPNVTVRLGEPHTFKVALTPKGETIELSSEPPLNILERNTPIAK
jgi:hypothetical protein